MMRRALFLSLIGSLAIVFAIQITGCSLIGLVIGAVADAGKPARTTVPRGQLAVITPGAEITLVFEDSTRVEGLYLGTGHVPAPRYATRYGAWRNSARGSASYPAVGDSVTLVDRFGHRFRAVFAGFSPRSVELAAGDGAGPRVFPLEDLILLGHGENRAIGGDSLGAADAAGELPSLTGLRIDRGQDTTLVATDEIARIEIPTQRHAARTGFFIGLVADAVVVVVAVASLEQAQSDLNKGCGNVALASFSDFGAGVRLLAGSFDRHTGKLAPPRRPGRP